MMRRAAKNLSVSAVVVLAFAAIFAPAAGAADWPVYRGPSHNGFTEETEWKGTWGADGPKVLWRASIGIGFSSITVADGRVYAMGNSGQETGAKDTVYCFDAATGKPVWTHSYDCELLPKYYKGGTLSTPTADGDVVYALSKVGDLFCLKAATGEVVWSKQVNKDLGCEFPTWHFSSSPMVCGDLLVLNLGDAGLALDKRNGQVVWTNGKGICGYSTPVPSEFAGQKAVCIAASDSVLAARLTDGKVLWKAPFVNQHKVNAADPIIAGNEVFASTGYGRGCIKIKIDGDKAETLLDSKVMRNHMNCSMLWKGHIYGFDESELKCVSFADFSQKWTNRGMGKGALIMSADGRMIIMSDKGELVIAKADPAAFEATARAQILPSELCWTAPTLANGRVYARNAAGDMVCVDVR